MNREIKFRVWDTKLSLMLDWESIKDTQVFWDALEGIDAEIMQFTGLLDKNGKEVYEGDIVNCIDTNPAIFEVKFIEGGFCCTSNNILPFDINSFYPSTGCRIEVIGNIHENPELMGGIK